MVFTEVLKDISSRVEGSIGFVVMGMDGIPIERHIVDRKHNFDLLSTEATTLLRTTRLAAQELAAGALQEVSFTTNDLIVVAIAITPEYVLLGALSNGSNIGKARFLMRRAALRLETEFV
jgi:predicted regulator of Ras-like GTPase activity (Roadblock/LC7/MglB family)